MPLELQMHPKIKLHRTCVLEEMKKWSNKIVLDSAMVKKGPKTASHIYPPHHPQPPAIIFGEKISEFKSNVRVRSRDHQYTFVAQLNIFCWSRGGIFCAWRLSHIQPRAPYDFYHPYDFLPVRPSEAPVGILRRCCSHGHIRLRAPYGLTRLYAYSLVE